jgi:serine/threonine-protein kinase RsbW
VRQLSGITAMVDTAHVLLDLSSRPENVPLVRQAVAGFADAVALARADLYDVSTAVTEACNNVSLHAYAGTEGPVEVELLAAGGSLLVAVRDRGVGLAPSDASIAIGLPRKVDGRIAGIGLPAIHGLASRVRLSERDSGGTEVAMEFDAPAFESDGVAREPGQPDRPSEPPGFGRRRRRFARGRPAREPLERHSIAPARLADTIELELAPLRTAYMVLPRVLFAAGARAYFPVDRLEGLRRVCERLFEPGRCWSPSSRVQAGVQIVPGHLKLRVGPLRAEDFEPLVAMARELDPGIEGLMPVPGVERPERVLLRVPRTPI